MKTPLTQLYWHDAELLEILLDRRNAGNIDIVSLRIKWPNGTKNTIDFTQCCKFVASLNFRIVAVESIRSFEICRANDEIDEIRSVWKPLGVMLPDLFCVRINTNSTNSDIEIYAEDYEIH